jgi:hypothetical protein
VWLYVPRELTSPSAPGSVDSNSDSEPSGPTCEPSAGWRETATRLWSSRGAWKSAEFWSLLLSGMTSQHSTPASGVALWIASLRASRASRGASPESAEESQTSGGSGNTSRTSFATWDPSGLCWRTCQGSLLEEELPEFSGRWPSSGSMRNGAVCERQTLAPRTSATGGSVWPTADASVAQDGESPETWLARRDRLKETKNNGNGCGTPLAMAAAMWPTAQAHDATTGKTPEQVAAMRARGHGVSNLNEVSANWQTPATDSFRSRGWDRKDEMGLDQQAKWVTPRAGAGQNRNTTNPPSCAEGRRGIFLSVQANMASHDLGHQAQASETSGDGSSEKTPSCPQRLNPTFVEWLMGFPRGWSDAFAENVCSVSATQSCPPRPRRLCTNS